MEEKATMSISEELLEFFKALADANRLKIVGVLAQGPQSVEQMAEILELHPSTVSHHLSRLAKAGLVSARAEGYYSMYQLEIKALESMAQRLLAKETLPAVSADIDLDAYDRKILKNYSRPDGLLMSIPMQEKKLQAVLRYCAARFEPDVQYTEKQVNEILKGVHEDFATLRRHLVDYGFMKREGNGRVYWKA